MLHQAGTYQLCLHLFPPRLVRNSFLSQFLCPFHDAARKKRENETTKIKEKATILHGNGAAGSPPSAQLLLCPNSLKVPHPLRNMLSSYSIPTPEQPTPPQQHTTTRSWKWNHNNNKRVIKVNTSREECQRGLMHKRVCFAFGAGRPS